MSKTTKKQQHSSILLFSQKCECPVTRKRSVCCYSSLFILDDSSLSDGSKGSLALQVSQNSSSDTAPAALLGTSHCPVSLLIPAMALQRLQEEKELEQPLLCWACQPLCRQEQSEGERQAAAQADLAYRHFDISCLARATIGCLPLSHQGFLNQVPYLQLILSTAEPGFVVCTFPPHIQQVSSSLYDLLRKTLQGTCLALLLWFLYPVCCGLSPGVQLFCVTWPVIIHAELCLAGKEGSGEMHGLSCSGKWGRVPKLSSSSKRTYFYTSIFSFLCSHTVLMLSLTYASIQKVNFLMVHRVSWQERWK